MTNNDLYTYKEIRQQPIVWQKAYEIVSARSEEIKAFVHRYLSDGYEIVLTGAGTSAYIGDALVPALFSTPFRGARALATTDILTAPELYFDASTKVLLVSFARSGNSPESVGTVKAVNATAGSVAHLFITCNPDGELCKMQGPNVLTLLLPPETNDKSLAMTSSYSTMLLVCAMVADIDRIGEVRKDIELLSGRVAAALDLHESDFCAVASKDFNRAVFLGSGALKGVAEECRLKLQELTDGRVICTFDSFLGFRHGPKAVVNADTLMVYLLGEDPSLRRYEMDLVRQIMEKNGVKASIVIGRSRPQEAWIHADICLSLELPAGIPDRYACVAYVVAGQLIGFFKSLDLGLCPDSPSVSGNISRVVEGVTLYI